ncbi:Hypothetical protein SMAX5B_000228 [Scophthalmus maximus]|nr:Hypothetical protein SMAX5B_000228 [Scophthalmus maximus]
MYGSCDKFVLKVNDGTFVIVREADDGPELYAADLQNGLQNALAVHISDPQDKSKKNQIALHCHHGKHPYILKVIEGTLKLEIYEKSNNLTDHYYFQIDNKGAGEYYGLQSVVDPMKFLSITKRKVCVSNIQNSFFFTVKCT